MDDDIMDDDMLINIYAIFITEKNSGYRIDTFVNYFLTIEQAIEYCNNAMTIDKPIFIGDRKDCNIDFCGYIIEKNTVDYFSIV